MKFGIIGAMEEEVAQLKEKMTNLTITTKAGMDFSICSVVTQYEILTNPGVPKESDGTSKSSCFFAFSQNALASSSKALTKR